MYGAINLCNGPSGASPIHGRAYPVSMVHKDIFCEAVERLEKLEVLKREMNSKCTIPTFIILKENETVRF